MHYVLLTIRQGRNADMAVVGATADLEVVDPARLPAAERDAQAPDAA
jgi:hypothetical protein